MRGAVTVLLVTACGAAPAPTAVASPTPVDGIELHVVRRWAGDLGPFSYRVDGAQACVDEEVVSGLWECTTTIPRRPVLEVYAHPTSPGDWFVEWTTELPADATGVELLADDVATFGGRDPRWGVELVFDRPLDGVTLDLVARRLSNGSPHTLVPGRFAGELTSHLETLVPSGWEEVAVVWQVCGMPGGSEPVAPGGSAMLDPMGRGRPALDGPVPGGPFRVATDVAVLVEPGGRGEPRRTERYTVSAPLDRLEDYAVLPGRE